jgi:hypothetical protein
MAHRVALTVLATAMFVGLFGCGGSNKGKLTFLAGTTLSAGECPSSGCAAQNNVVLGKKNLLRDGWGWGTTHPHSIFNGGDPGGEACHLTWRNWSGASAYARGLAWIFRPGGNYYGKPGVIELRASRIGRCTRRGPHAYTFLQVREPVRPGGPLGRWFAWGGWKSICKGPI